jgi:hypothetical protein
VSDLPSRRPLLDEQEQVIRIDVPVRIEVLTEHHHDDGSVAMTKRPDLREARAEEGRFGQDREVFQCPACGTRVTVDIATDVDVNTTMEGP